MNRSSKILLTALGIAGVGALAYYLLKREEYQKESKEKAAMDFLKETYGEEALAGKKLILIDDVEADQLEFEDEMDN